MTSTSTIVNATTIHAHFNALKGFQGIDLGCIADKGSFFIDYNGKEDVLEIDFQKRYESYYANRTFLALKFSKPHNSLVTFFMQLTRYLQQAIGTVPAIDLQAYLGSIGEEIDEVL